MPHDFSFSAKSTHRHTATNDLTKGSEIGFDVVDRLRTAEGDTETGHYLIKNQYGAVLIALLS